MSVGVRVWVKTRDTHHPHPPTHHTAIQLERRRFQMKHVLYMNTFVRECVISSIFLFWSNCCTISKEDKTSLCNVMVIRSDCSSDNLGSIPSEWKYFLFYNYSIPMYHFFCCLAPTQTNEVVCLFITFEQNKSTRSMFSNIMITQL